MTDNFPKFAKVVADNFRILVEGGNAFVVDIDGDTLYAEYLKAFPEGTNPVFKKTTEHDCSNCKHFIRRVGMVIADSGNTVWDMAATIAPHPYNVVAQRLRELVKAAPIVDLFRTSPKEPSFGAKTTHSLDAETQRALTWEHFYTGPIPRSFVVPSPDAVRGEYRTTVQVFERGLTELSTEAVDTVLSLIDANSLYRGEEHRASVVKFREMQQRYRGLDEKAKKSFVWQNATGPASRFRNTVIGTLVQDLSEGRGLEAAVASFEQKVAPTNYKRTTALITPGMVKKAMETISTLGLESALERRFAVIGDISVKDVLWVDGGVKAQMKGGLEEALMKHAEASSSPKVDAGTDIGLDSFIKTVLPEATSMDLFFKGEHLGNLVSLTAPVHAEPKQLFRWNNDFAWSYGGNVTDSIKERVKKAGGRVEGALLRVSLSWFNYDDLDLHIHEPQSRDFRSVYGEIYYGNKRGWTGGTLDVDMNAGGPRSREAVENTVWHDKVPDGDYRVVVNNYTQRETTNVGFVIEVECDGNVSHFSYNKTVRNKQSIDVVTLRMQGGHLVHMTAGDPAITAANISQEKWGLKTEQFVKVNAVTYSPNYWGDNAVGNKHTIFLLNECVCDEPMRGIYNEFLHPRLETHRKVFEVIGDKTKCQPIEGQLSGLGFSSTKKDSFLVKVYQGKKQRVFNVKVGA